MKIASAGRKTQGDLQEKYHEIQEEVQRNAKDLKVSAQRESAIEVVAILCSCGVSVVVRCTTHQCNEAMISSDANDGVRFCVLEYAIPGSVCA